MIIYHCLTKHLNIVNHDNDIKSLQVCWVQMKKSPWWPLRCTGQIESGWAGAGTHGARPGQGMALWGTPGANRTQPATARRTTAHLLNQYADMCIYLLSEKDLIETKFGIIGGGRGWKIHKVTTHYEHTTASFQSIMLNSVIYID